MSQHFGTRRPSIVLGVTSAQSLRLMQGFPDYLVACGWEVHVVCSDPPTVQPSDWALHSVPMRRDPSPLRDLYGLLHWIIMLLKLRPDIVVSGTPKAGLLGTLAARVTRCPTRIYMLRGLRLSTVRGTKRRVLHALEKVVMSSATQVHAISASLAREAVSLGLTAPDNVTVLGSGSSNGVAIPPLEETEVSQEARREQLGLPQGPTIGYVGRIHPDKGVEVLLEAMNLIDGVSNSQLLIVGGEDSPGYMESLLYSSKVDRKRVHWVGNVTDPSQYYRAMDVLCLPTMREGFGNVIMEAAAHGVPAIASRVTGCVDAVVDGVTGHLFPPEDPHSLARILESALTRANDWAALGAAAKSRAEVEFDRHKVWHLTEEFYRLQLLRSRPVVSRGCFS